MNQKLINGLCAVVLTGVAAIALWQEQIGHGKRPVTSLPPLVQPAAAPRGGPVKVPTKLIGKWSYGSVSPTTFWDSNTGVFRGNARGSASIMQFNADGTYTEYTYFEITSYSIKTTSWTVQQGKIDFDNQCMDLTVTSGHYLVHVNDKVKTDRDMTPEEMKKARKSYAWRLDTDEKGVETLVFPFEDGSKLTYKRAEEAK